MALDQKKYFFFTIKDITISKVFDLLFGKSSFITGYKISQVSDFVNYDGGTGVKNLDRILAKYTEEDKLSYSFRFDYKNFPIIFGTVLLLPFEKIDRVLIPLLDDNLITSTDVNAFLANQLRENYNNPKNIRVAKSRAKSLGVYKDMYTHISVWIWSRALSAKVSNNEIEYQDTILNVTPFIANIDTNVNQNGGSFNFTLDNVLAKFENGKWKLHDSTIKKTKAGEVISHSIVSDINQKRASLFFNSVLQENDVVFIRFENLESETDRIERKNQTFEIDKKELQFKNFDMIGLIDHVRVENNFADSDISINVDGRDLMKLFIEDGVYFYPFDFIENGIFANTTNEEQLKRYDGQLISRFQTQYKKIDNVLQFIINALGTIKICSDTLFESFQNLGYKDLQSQYGVIANPTTKNLDRRSLKYKINNSDNVEQEPLKGIWQIIKLVIDHSVHNRVLADSSIGNEHGSLLNAVRKICQEPWVEFYGDTYGDMYYLTVRKPPFDKEGLLSLIDGIVLDERGVKQPTRPIIISINDEDILNESLSYGGEAFSWYRLTPQGSINGGEGGMAFAYLRAVYLKEYADIYGSKPFDTVSNYIPFQPILSKDSSPSIAYMLKQAIYDLQYLIQSHAYLPFIRRGTITIANGDRRIKKGTLVKLESTNEIGIVEAVHHHGSYSLNKVDRITTISVDRLMIEKYIKGVNVKDVGNENTIVSYFNLVNTDIDELIFNSYEITGTGQQLNKDFNKEVLSKWKTNKDVFNFFLQKRQFA